MTEVTRATKVYVRGSDDLLESAVARTLAQSLGDTADVRIGEPDPAAGRGVFVTTDSTATRRDVRRLANDGQEVVVLAAFPNDAEEDEYRKAGARAYLPMVATVAPLVAAVAALVAFLAETL